jgi:hypothetical protein
MNVRPRRWTTVDPAFCFNDFSELRTFMITFLSSYAKTAFDTLKFRRPCPQDSRGHLPCEADSVH